MVEVTFATGNRITIPKPVANQLNIPLGTKLQLEIEGNKLILTIPTKSENKKVEEVLTKDKELVKQVNTAKATKHIKIVSNLQEGMNFKVKYFSPCKLVIRTKNSYLKDFCSVCKGQLVKEHIDLTYRECPYIEQSPKKQIIQKLANNVSHLNKVLDEKIKQTKKELEEDQNSKLQQDLYKLKLQGKIKLQPFAAQNKEAVQCKHCKLYFDKGFLLDDTFYCKDCTKTNFKNYFKKYKELEEKGMIK